jgi:tRNA A-37 threonylcarbamoyl transferase component Bud32
MGRAGRVEKRDTALVGGRYRLDEQLGTGGMSVVWRGYDEVLGRRVAVKVLSSQLADDQAFRERLRQEALAAARLCHPHITGIFDYGESTVDGVTVPYVVMELNDGESVSARLTRRGPLPWREAVTVAVEVASALAAAHARGVVHRDVTPANVMLTSAGAKVVDFGISALIGERDASPDGSLLGTPAYLAPERLTGGQVSPATDVYALGLLLYRALTGRLPWPAETTTEALRAHLYADPEPIPSQAGMPPEVAELCLRCLAKAPADRPDAAEVARDLADTGLQAVIAPLLPTTPAAAYTRPPTARPSATRQPSTRPSPRPDRTAVAVASGPAGMTDPGRRTAGPLSPRPGRLAAALLGGGLSPAALLATVDRPIVGRGLFGRALSAGRRRVHAVAATVTLLAVVSLTWASAQEPTDTGTAQAAAVGTGTPAGVLHPTKCRVRYQVRRDSGSTFDVSLVIRNIGDNALHGWQLEFAFPGNQRLTAPGGDVGEIDQRGRSVVIRATGASTLGPGKAVEAALRGTYRGSNPLPLAFTMDGRTCRAEVLGSVVTDPGPVDDPGSSSDGDPAQVHSASDDTSGGSAGSSKSTSTRSTSSKSTSTRSPSSRSTSERSTSSRSTSSGSSSRHGSVGRNTVTGPGNGGSRAGGTHDTAEQAEVLPERTRSGRGAPGPGRPDRPKRPADGFSAVTPDHSAVISV